MSRSLLKKAFSRRTEEQYRGILKIFLSQVNVETCTPYEVQKFLRSSGWGNSRQYVASIAIRHFLRWKFGDHPALRIRVKRDKPHPGRTLNETQILNLFRSFDLTTPKGCRDYAILCLALDTGLRVNEIASIVVDDLNLVDRELTVKVKGGRWERAFFSKFTAKAIERWLPFRDLKDPRLFQVTRDGLRVIVRKWGQKIGLKVSPHDFRRTFAVLAIKAGAPTRLVQVAGRWTDIRMVEHYTRSISAVDLGPYFPTSNLEKVIERSLPD